jgi:hypothetical protein
VHESESQPVPPWWTDPTVNVQALVEAAMKRQDDLRDAERYHIREIMTLRAQHYSELRQAEADRINAIQTRSDLTVQRAAEVQAAQAQTLANQVATTADAFRASLAAALAPIMASIEDLRRAQYEAQGQKTQVVESRGSSQFTATTVIAATVAVATILTLILLYVTKK